MSSEINIKLKRKGQSHKEAITLMWLSTTPTRELIGGVDLVYAGGRKLFSDNVEIKSSTEEEINHFAEYGYNTVLTKEKLNEIIDYYRELINELKIEKEKTTTKLNNMNKLLSQAISVDVYERIKEDINELTIYQEDTDERISDYDNILNRWLYSVLSVFEDNKTYSSAFEEYELIYYVE